MKRWWLNSMLFKKEFEHRCRLSKSTSSLGPIENASESKDPNINDTDKNIQSWGGHDNYSNVDLFFGVKDLRNLISDDTFLVKDKSSFYRNSSYLNNGSKSKNPEHDPYMNDTQYTWNNHINSCIDSYLQSQICIDSYIVSGSDNSSNNYISSSICGESGNSSKNEDARTSDPIIRESSTDLDVTQKYRHLWVQCENCYGLNYKKFLNQK
ncbi:Acetyl-coenzyme A carboxylase carboxyl transferase subunit beta [Helianthus annuus]|nr:Acetyl-coenzyme A carboxylase carboxyl transferase subunit beta [Helianthus annuus]